MKTVFVNPERCIGCRQCEFSCAVAHSQSQDPAQAIVETPLPRSRIHILPGPALHTSFPNRCRHCEPAPCVVACPTGAMSRDEDQDVVLADSHKCIACAMCAMVCPFDAIDFHAQATAAPARIVAVKCDGCIERVQDGLEPACVEACKSGALVFGELNELIAAGRASEISAVFSAVAATPLPARIPASVAGWRAWGASAAHVNQEVHHGQS